MVFQGLRWSGWNKTKALSGSSVPGGSCCLRRTIAKLDRSTGLRAPHSSGRLTSQVLEWTLDYTCTSAKRCCERPLTYTTPHCIGNTGDLCCRLGLTQSDSSSGSPIVALRPASRPTLQRHRPPTRTPARPQPLSATSADGMKAKQTV